MMNGIETITDKIISEAYEYADAAIAETDYQVAEIRDKYASEASYIIKKAEEKAKRDAEGIVLRASSSAESLKRNMILEAKMKLCNEVFEAAQKRILSLPADEYRALLEKLLTDSMTAKLADEAETKRLGGTKADNGRCFVLLNKADREAYGAGLVDTFNKKYKSAGKTASLSENCADIPGGFVLVFGNIEINCSLAVVMKEVRERLENDVCRILFK